MSSFPAEPDGEWLPRAEHVWVTDFPNQGPAPGLLLGWRRSPGGWEGWLVSAQLGADGAGPADVRQRWVDAASIQRA